MDDDFVYPKNPIVAEICKENKKRSFRLSALKGEKGICKWCLSPAGPRKKYCSKACSDSAWAFFYPQIHADRFLLKRQENRCAHCKYEWVEGRYLKDYEVGMAHEVDHIIPIFKGGEILGIENIQLLCSKCHRIKSANERRIK